MIRTGRRSLPWSIAGLFKPEFQQVGTQARQCLTAVKDKLGMVDADSPEAKQPLSSQSTAPRRCTI